MSLKTRAVAVLGLATLALSALAPTAMADSGGLDTTYGTGGRAQLPAALGTTTVADSLKLSDGSVVITGSAGNSGSRDLYVAKYAVGGTLDPNFGTSGVLTFDAGGDDFAYGISLRGNGGFVIAGATNSDPDLGIGFVAKTNALGVLDAGWGVAGVLPIHEGTAIPGNEFGRIEEAVELAGGDVMYAAIQDSGQQTFFGHADSTGDGVTQGFGAYYPTDPFATVVNILDLAKRSDGLWELATTTQTPTGIEVTLTTFDDGAVVGSGNTLAIANTQINTVRLQSDDSLLAVGSTTTGPGDPQRGAFFKFTPALALDNAFGTAGVIQLPTASETWTATDFDRTSSGSYYVVGDLGTNRARVLMLTSGFALDTAFADGGIADRSYGESPNRTVRVHVDPSDRPVVTGTLGTAAAAFRVERFDYAAFTLGPVTYSPSFVQRLNTVNFSYSVKNNGPDASDVTVDIDIPASFESQNYSTTFGTATPVADRTGATWSIPQLAAGSTATLTLSGKPGDVGTLTTTANVTGQSAVRPGAAPAAATTSVMVYGAATPRDDVITGTPRKDIIDALAGNDIVHALAGNDVVSGNVGNDQLFGELGDDTLSGDEGNDLVDGGKGNDVAAGGTGNDRVLGGEGNDKVDGGPGNDVVDGGTGNDKAAGGTGNDLLYGRSGNDRLDSGDGNDKVFAGTGNDTVFGGNGADKLYGEGGNDYLIAQGSGDQLFGGPGRDRLDGGADADKIFGGTGGDFINGKTGNDYMNGNSGDDWIRGFAGNDTLIGEGGDDLLNGGAGMDKFSAGSGDDIVRADDGFGGDTIDCGVGWDLVYANPGDRVSGNCEYVKYDVPAGTRFSGERGSDAPKLWAQRVRRG